MVFVNKASKFSQGFLKLFKFQGMGILKYLTK